MATLSQTAASAMSITLTPEQSSIQASISSLLANTSKSQANSTSTASGQLQSSSTTAASTSSTLSTIVTATSQSSTSTSSPTATSPAASRQPTSSNGSLSTAKKAGISLAAIVVVIIILLGLLFLLRRLRKRKERLAQQHDVGDAESSTQALAVVNEKPQPNVRTTELPAEENRAAVTAPASIQNEPGAGVRRNRSDESDASYGFGPLPHGTS